MVPGFTLNGQHCSVLGIIMESKTLPILTKSKDVYIDIPGRDGSYLFKGALSDAVIPILCGIKTANAIALMAAKRQIAAWVFSKEKVRLIFDDEPDKFYLVKYDGEIGLEKMTAQGMGKFTLIFRCEPFAYDDQVIANFVADTVTVTNAGTAETEPYFQTTFTATCTEWKITLGTDYCRVVHAFGVGDVLTMDFATGAVLLNGVRAMNLLDWQNSRFFTLPVGVSTLTVTPAGKSATLIKYTPKWR